MKDKGNLSKIANHTVKKEPGASLHNEGHEKAERANHGIHNILALGLIHLSLLPWVALEKLKRRSESCSSTLRHKDGYPLPRVDESLSRPSNAEIYIGIDVAWDFLANTCEKSWSFASELGLFDWRRMPFGMCNPSATFQRAKARALKKLWTEMVVC